MEVTLVLLCFAVGYARMSRRRVNTGGFYTYVGLGRPAGVAGAFIAVLAYCTQTFGLVGGFGYFAALITFTTTGLPQIRPFLT